MTSWDAPVLAIDVGTSAVKCGLAHGDGTMVTAARTVGTRAAAGGVHEVDAGDWLRALAACIGELGTPPALSAVVVTGNGPTVVPAGADGQALHPAITWLDRRSGDEVRLIAERTGRAREASFFLAKIYWVFRHAPELYRHTRGFVSGPEYVALRLTGCWHTALPAPAFQRYYWDDELVSALAMDPAKLPPFVATGTPLGSITAAAAAEFGIPASVPVFAGAPDYVMAMLGTGAVTEGATCNRSGSSDGVNYCCRHPVSDRRLLCLPHIVDGLFSVAGLISTTGKALEWFAGIAHDDRTLYERAARCAPGSDGVLFLPYLAGERTPLWRSDVRAVFSGLGLEHGREQMARAVLEAVGYALRDSLTLIEELAGPVDAIRLSGARAGNQVLNRIKADIVGCPLQVPEVLDAELTGCACVAARALGVDASVADAAQRLVRIGATIEPRAQYAAVYEEGFARYLKLQKQL
jgi:xylulokinase